MLYRASSSAAPATPSKTPVSVTQSLSNLRLAHARLMEEHGSNVALLRHREQELSELQERETRAEDTMKQLRNEVRDLKDRALRSEHKASLAEREVSFLQAMLVSLSETWGAPFSRSLNCRRASTRRTLLMARSSRRMMP